MLVAIASSAIHTCPCRGYGSETTAWYLTQELCALGHEVFLFAPTGSKRPPNGALIPLPLCDATHNKEWEAAEALSVTRYAPLLSECDVIHDMTLSARTAEEAHRVFGDRIPHLATLNGICYDRPRAPADHGVVVVSEASKRCGMEGLGAWSNTPWEHAFEYISAKLTREPFVVRYGVDDGFYSPRGAVGDAVLYVGRPHPAKGIEIVLDLAERLPEQPFVLAWRADMQDHKLYEERYLDAIKARHLRNIHFEELPAGEGHHERKRDLQASAAVAIHPAVYVDACPSSLLEALLCGTPVVSTQHGGTPEIVVDGADGYLLSIPLRYWDKERYSTWLDEWAVALLKARKLDRAAIRARAVERHSARRMALDYLALYEKLRATAPR